MEITLVLQLNRVLQLLHFAKCNLHVYGVFSIFCIIGLNQKSLVRSNFLKKNNFYIKRNSLHMWDIYKKPGPRVLDSHNIACRNDNG